MVMLKCKFTEAQKYIRTFITEITSLLFKVAFPCKMCWCFVSRGYVTLKPYWETQAGLVLSILMWENDGGFWHVSITKLACARQHEILFLGVCSIVNTSLVYFYWVNLGGVCLLFFFSFSTSKNLYISSVCRPSWLLQRGLETVQKEPEVRGVFRVSRDVAWWGLRQICLLSLSHVTASVMIADLQWCNIIWTLRLLTNVTLKQSMCF